MQALTRRELEVLSRVARGETNGAIGAALGISPRTVQKHLQRVFKKLGVRTRTAAVARAAEQFAGAELGLDHELSAGWATLADRRDSSASAGPSSRGNRTA